MAEAMGGLDARALRIALAQHAAAHPVLAIGGNTITDWVRLELKVSLEVYTRRIAHGGWGGALELATCAHRYGRQVHVFEPDTAAPRADTYICISQFGSAPTIDIPPIYLLYKGRCHYDLMVPREDDLPVMSPRSRVFRARLVHDAQGQPRVDPMRDFSFCEDVEHVDLTVGDQEEEHAECYEHPQEELYSARALGSPTP